MTTIVEPRTESSPPIRTADDPPFPDGAARWLRRLWPLPAALAVVAAITLVPDWGSAGPAPGEAFVSVDGSARVERVDGTVEMLVGGDGGARPAETTLRQGDGLDLVSGRADLELAGSIRMEAAEGVSLLMGRTPDLRGGELLVTGEETAEVSSGGTRVRLAGSGAGPVAARLARTAGLSVGLYQGSAQIDSAGTSAAVAAFRRVEVPALGEVTGAQPIRYDAADPWDRRFLGDAIALDQQLASLLRGFVASAGRDAGSAANLAKVLQDVEGVPSRRELARLVDPDRPADDLLVGATISGLARGGSYADRWRATFRFRDAGAGWGLVALDRDVDWEALLAALAGAVEDADLEFETEAGSPGDPVDVGGGSEEGGPTTAPGGGGSGGGGDPGAGSDGGGSGGGDDDPVIPTLPPVPPVPTVPTVPPTTGPIGGIVDGLGDTVEDVVDGLGDTIGDVVEPDPDDGPDCLLGVVCG